MTIREIVGQALSYARTCRSLWLFGLAHWGVLLRIGLIYLAATVGSLLLFAAPCVLALLAFGPIGAVVLGIPAVIIGVPWLVTLYLVQAFAWRIAVIENRHPPEVSVGVSMPA